MIQSLAQWVKDLALWQLWHRSQLWLSLIPGPGTPYATRQPEKKKKKKKEAEFGQHYKKIIHEVL